MQDISNVSWPGWEVVRLIGRGSFGAVYEIERDTFGHKEQAALKVITLPQNASDIDDLYSDGYDAESITMRFQSYLKDIVHEYSVMVDMKGFTNVVYCDDLRYVQHDDGIGWDIYIKMELLTPLTKVLGKDVSDEQVIRIGMDICNALTLCKDRNIIHRDIKPQNIFVSKDGNYKLGDFGIAKTAERTTSGTKVGTYKFMAPEVYNNQPYGASADIYSLGLVMYWLLNERRTPFLPLPPQVPTASEEETARKRRFDGEEIPTPAHGSAGLQAVVLKACAFDPKRRFTDPGKMIEALGKLDAEGMGEYMAPNKSAENDTTVDKKNEDADIDNTIGTVGLFSNIPKKAEKSEENVEIYQEEADKTVGVFEEIGEKKEPELTPPSNMSEAKDVPEKSKKKRHWIILVAMLCLLMVIIGAVFSGWAEKNDEMKIEEASEAEEMLDMPNVVGISEKAALTELQKSGLIVKIEYKYSPEVKLNSVISQSVEAGKKVEKDTTVTLEICSMDGMVKVRNVVNMKSAEAQKALEDQGLHVTIKEIESDGSQKGLVISQKPAADSVEKAGEGIVLFIGEGSATDTEESTNTLTVTESKKETGTKKEPGPWSDWSTGLPSNVSASGYDIEEKVQYRYRDKETTSSESSSLSGWARYDSSSYWTDYGSWSGWSTSAVSSSSSRQVDTRTTYMYCYFYCYNCGNHWHGYGFNCYTWGGGCGKSTIQEGSYTEVWGPTPQSQINWQDWHGTGHTYTTYNGERVFRNIYSPNASRTEYRYRDRSQVTTYYYERWGSWSSWSDSPVSGSSNRQVNTRTVYRYRTKGT